MQTQSQNLELFEMSFRFQVTSFGMQLIYNIIQIALTQIVTYVTFTMYLLVGDFEHNIFLHIHDCVKCLSVLCFLMHLMS